MRDLLITLFILGAIPYILQRPHIGILMWSWIGYMNPHRYGWGFAYSMPFALITIIALLIGMLFSKEKKTFPVTGVTIVWILFLIWAVISTLFATNIDNSLIELNRFSKIQFAVMCTLLLMTNKERLMQLVWVIVISIGFYGVKGGIFSIAHGLQFRVNGPPESFISGNNEIALAILMVIPLMYFLKLHTKNKYIRLALLGSMVLCAVPPEAFEPAPKVESAFVRCVPHKTLPFVAKDKALFAKVVMAAFGQRRKTIRNTLKDFLSDDDFEKLKISSQLRAENLSVSDFVGISNFCNNK